MRRRLGRFAVLLPLAFAVGLLLGGGSYLGMGLARQWRPEPMPRASAAASGPLRPLLMQTIPDLVQRASPAVVKVNTTLDVAAPTNPYFDNPFFEQFFGAPNPTPLQEWGIGSGFFVDKSGLIVTNNHVIAGAKTISVSVVGLGTQLPATVVGADSALDLAVLRVKPPSGNLPVLPLASSSHVRPGDFVVAIGNPYGLSHTVTVGVVSAQGRPIRVGNTEYHNLLQTDAAINPGNSGGPLLNLAGQVVGINTAVAATGQGIGFAIPVSTVRAALPELIKNGHLDHPWLGLAVVDAAQTGGSAGARVVGVWPGSPAAAVGVAIGDVVVRIDQTPVTSAGDLVAAVSEDRVGQRVTLRILRQGGAVAKTVKLGLEPATPVSPGQTG